MSEAITSDELLHEAMSRNGSFAKQWGQKVSERRNDLELSRMDVATFAGVRPETVFKIEKGTRYPSDTLKVKLASALGCEVDRLFPMPSMDDVNERFLSDAIAYRRLVLQQRAAA